MKRGLNRASLIVGLQLTVVCLLVVLFQNCGPGFDPAASQTKSNSLGGGNSTPPPQAGTLEPVDEPPGIPRFNGPPPPTSFTKNAKLSAIALNTALDLGAFTCPGIEGGLPDGCRRLMEYSGFTYDFHRHEMLMFGGGHATVMNNDVLRFDFGELVWKGSYTPNSCASHTAANFDSATALFKDTGRPASTHTYDQLVISKRDGNLVKLFAGGLSGAVCNSQDAYWGSGGAIHIFDPDTNAWRAVLTSESAMDHYGASELDPDTDWTINLGENKIGIYDNKTDKFIFSQFHNVSGLSYAKNLVYFPPNKRFYYIVNGDSVFELTIDRAAIEQLALEGKESSNYFTLGKLVVTGDTISYPETGFAFDSHNNLIGGGIVGGRFYALDPLAKKWFSQSIIKDSQSADELDTISFHAIDFDPVNGVYIFVSSPGQHTWAYRW